MKKPKLFIGVFILLPTIWILNVSLKNPSTHIINKAKTFFLKDTISKHITPLYADTTLYSGYLGNLWLIRNQILNKKRIDSLLKIPPPIYHVLTNQDRKNYIFTIDQNAIRKLKDTVIYGKRYRITSVPLRFMNRTNDTLTYLGMDCSWLDYYFTSNSQIGFDKQLCYKNEPCVNVIPPHHAVIIYIPIAVSADEKSFNQKFKIGMSLQKYIDRNQLDIDPFCFFLRTETSNVIWSNEIWLPN